MTKGRPPGSKSKHKKVPVTVRYEPEDITDLNEFGLRKKYWNRNQFITDATNEKMRREKK